MPGPSELRVFISSTFKDLQEERSYLMKHVFPEVRQRCRERGIEFTEIDLRWGLTHEEGTLGRIIRTCFEEIDKCRPFFVGILGSRFGWVPQYLDLQKDPELLRKFPWIEEEVLDGASLLELEFSHAVLNYDGEMPGAFFYARDQGVIIQDVPDVERKHIAELRRRMDHSKRPVRTFADVRALGEQVRADMLAAIDERWPLDERHTRTAAERRGHEAFSAARRHAYIANPENLQLLHAHAAGDGPPLMVVGESGLGKSALLAFWSHTYKHKHPQAFVITHFTGSTPAGGAHSDVVRRILAEIKERAGWDDEIPTKQDELEQALPLWLARLQEPLVLVIDALNQLDERSRDLSWLPAFIPSHIRVVLSATPGEESEVAVLRGWRTLQLQPLTMAEREALVVRFLGEYRKGLSSDQCDLIAHGPHCDNPLFLRTVLEELRLFGYFEELDAHIVHYLAASSLQDLFQRVLRRIENDFGIGVLRNVMSSIWASRNGLTEGELMEIVGLTRVECSRLLIALDYHLMQRDGRRTFFHDYVRKAVESRYLNTDNLRKMAHATLGDYFAAQEISERRVEEEPWQWQMAEEWERLRSCLVALPMFTGLYRPNAEHVLLGYWLAIGDRYDMTREYSEALSAFRKNILEKKELARLEHDLGKFFTASSRYDEAETMLRAASELLALEYGNVDLRTVACLDDLGGVLYYKGQLDEAETVWRMVLNVRTAAYEKDDPRLCESLDNLTALLYAKGRYREAEDLCRRSLAINESVFGPKDLRTSSQLNNLASVLTAENQVDEAFEAMRRAVDIKRTILGVRHPEVARSMMNLAVVCIALHRYAEAEMFSGEALSTLVSTLGKNHELVGLALMNAAGALSGLDRLAEAMERYNDAVHLYVALHGPHHSQTIHTRCMRALLYAKMGDYETAISEHEELLPLQGQLEGKDHPRFVSVVRRYIELLDKIGRNDLSAPWVKLLDSPE